MATPARAVVGGMSSFLEPFERLAARHVRTVLPVLFTAAVFAVRWQYTGKRSLGFLLFNVLLGGVPLACAGLATVAHAHRRKGLAALALLVGLVFLPNAPYVVTDLMHLRARPFVPLWFDAAFFASAALAGVVLGVAALDEAGATLASWFGPRATTCVLLLATLVSGFGIYLGRFVRLNSWDVLFRPRVVLHDALAPVLHPLAFARAWAVTLLMGGLFTVAHHARRHGS
jgi:uncharacterized membrane protein